MPLDTPAAQALFITASICVVLLTLAALVVLVMVAWAAAKIRALAQRLDEETRRIIEVRRRITRRTRFVTRWLELLFRAYRANREH